MPFQPGQSGNPAGRAKGSVNKAWASLKFWYDKIEDVWDDLPKSKQAEIALDLFKVILSKRNLPAETPEESVANADTALSLLKEMGFGTTGNGVPGTDRGSEAVGMAQGDSGIQVSEHAEVHKEAVAGSEANVSEVLHRDNTANGEVKLSPDAFRGGMSNGSKS